MGVCADSERNSSRVLVKMYRERDVRWGREQIEYGRSGIENGDKFNRDRGQMKEEAVDA